MKRRILIVAMLDSIHTAHWLERVNHAELIIDLFPSRIYRKVHPKIIGAMASNSNLSIIYPSKYIPKSIHGYFDFINYRFGKLFKFEDRRLAKLQYFVSKNEYSYLHALEIQGAGYLCNKLTIPASCKFILTNWGSDIYFYQQIPTHVELIRGVLNKADYYSAECERDYVLARQLGFSGIELPVIPNSGGNYRIDDLYCQPRERLIVVKCYGGKFGRGDIAIQAISSILADFSDVSVYFYSVSAEYVHLIEHLAVNYPGRIRYKTIRNRVNHSDLMAMFRKAIIYLGCSESDGISTSFLEAISNGVYPVQSNSSCANEWVSKGIEASIVPLNVDSVYRELVKIFENSSEYELRSRNNQKLAAKYLDPSTIRDKAQQFYNR